MTVVATLKDGRVIAKIDLTATVVAATTDTGIDEKAVPDLRDIEYILQFNLETDPNTHVIGHDAWHNGNAVGLTVYAGAGTTVSGEAIVIGY